MSAVTPENVKFGREVILGLAKEASTCGAVLRSLKAGSESQVQIVIGVDREVFDAFTDEDAPVKEFTTFVSRRLLDSPEVAFEITAFKATDE